MNELTRRGAARIAENEFWLLWVFAAPLLFSSNVPPVVLYGALLTIPFFWFARRIARGSWTIATPLDIPLLALLGLGIIAVLVSNDRATSLRLYAEWVGGIGLYYALVNGLTTVRLEKGVWILLALGAAMGVVGLLGLRYSDKFLPIPLIYDALPKFDFAFLNPRGFTPNIVAGALAPLVPLAIAWGYAQTRVWRIAGGVFAFFLIGVIVLTQSRGALLGLGLVLCGFVLWRAQRLRWLVLVVLALGIVAAVMLGVENVGGIILASDANDSAVSRVELWDRALRMLRDFPFTGIGIGNFEATILTLYPLLENSPGVPQPHAHNLYLQMGVDFGIGGMVAYLGLVTTTLAIGLQNVKRAPRAKQWLAYGLLAGYAVFLIHSLLDAVMVSTKVSFLIWFLLALLMALARSVDETPAP